MTPELPPLPPGRWRPRLEAAKRLGITERTLQRKMKQGLVMKRHDEHGRLQVYVPDRQDSGHETVHDTAPDTALAVEHTRLAEVAGRFLARNAEQEALIRSQAEQIGALTERLRLAEQPPAPWWRALWQRLSGHRHDG